MARLVFSLRVTRPLYPTSICGARPLAPLIRGRGPDAWIYNENLSTLPEAEPSVGCTLYRESIHAGGLFQQGIVSNLFARREGSVGGDEADITVLLKRFQDGDRSAESELITAVHDELRTLASRYMARERLGHTLQTTALVNEAYLRLVKAKAPDWQNRSHFFAVAAQVMRRILVDHARLRIAGKRGGGLKTLPIEEGLVFSPDRCGELVQLDDALERLAAEDPRVSRIIELRFFGGLSLDETASVLNMSPRSVSREWTFGRAWLRKELNLGGEEDAGPVG